MLLLTTLVYSESPIAIINKYDKRLIIIKKMSITYFKDRFTFQKSFHRQRINNVKGINICIITDIIVGPWVPKIKLDKIIYTAININAGVVLNNIIPIIKIIIWKGWIWGINLSIYLEQIQIAKIIDIKQISKILNLLTFFLPIKYILL